MSKLHSVFYTSRYRLSLSFVIESVERLIAYTWEDSLPLSQSNSSNIDIFNTGRCEDTQCDIIDMVV